jgi:hypothetical protein
MTGEGATETPADSEGAERRWRIPWVSHSVASLQVPGGTVPGCDPRGERRTARR